MLCFCATVAPMDYESLDVILMFDLNERNRQCVNVKIGNDFENEPDQNFYYTLEITSDLNTYIGLHQMNGEIVIVDDDGYYIILI